MKAKERPSEINKKLPQSDKGHLQKTAANITFNGEGPDAFP